MADEREENYPNFAQFVWYERLHFCGCGNPEDVMQRLGAVLKHINEQHPPGGMNWNPIVDVELIELYVLAAGDLTEHGGSVGGCWLTPDGERLLAEIDSSTAEALMGAEL